MHTSNATFYLFWGAVILSAAAQLFNYWSTAIEQRTCKRKLALGIGLTAVCLGAIAGYRAAIDWSALPHSNRGLRSGQLYNNGGEPAIVP